MKHKCAVSLVFILILSLLVICAMSLFVVGKMTQGIPQDISEKNMTLNRVETKFRSTQSFTFKNKSFTVQKGQQSIDGIEVYGTTANIVDSKVGNKKVKRNFSQMVERRNMLEKKAVNVTQLQKKIKSQFSNSSKIISKKLVYLPQNNSSTLILAYKLDARSDNE